jgi:membrane protein implicated in regulation of membrane protease activity
MDETTLWILEIIAPAILLIVLIWLVIKVRSNRDNPENRRAEEGTRDLYAEEEQRRREGTDKL